MLAGPNPPSPRTLALALFVTVLGCNGDPPADTDAPPVDTDPPPPAEALAFAPDGPQTVQYDDYVTFTIAGLADDQAYRLTLVHGDQISAAGDGTATFQDLDANGYADAGPSETVALISNVNFGAITPAKTVPAATDDPANPTGVFEFNGEMVVQITGIGGGTVYPVVYHNGGVTTFLEVDAAGTPTETYHVGPAITVNGPVRPDIVPATPTTVAVDGTTTYTLNSLDNAQAYRITLVHGDYLVATGPDAVFEDGDANGYADAGASEAIALITAVNATPLATAAKTVPAATDDPAAPTGVFPIGGQIVLELTGIGAGTVYPVAYHNGGTTTFLELDPVSLEPTEIYSVGGSLTVTP